MTGVRRPRLLIAVIAFAALLGTLTQALFVPLLGILPDELGVSATAVSWLITGVLVTGVVASAITSGGRYRRQVPLQRFWSR